MSLEQFKASQLGAVIRPLLTTQAALERMEEKSRLDRPAVEAIGSEIQRHVGGLDHTQRKMVGRWVKELLADRGWRPDRKGRVAPGHFFNRGTIYRRPHTPADKKDGATGLSRARALLELLPKPIMSSDEFIAQRRQAFRGES